MNIGDHKESPVTTRALLRKGRFPATLRDTKRGIRLGWVDVDPVGNKYYASSPDEEFAEFHGLRIAKDGHRNQVVIPPYLIRNVGQDGKRGRNSIFYQISFDLERNFLWMDEPGSMPDHPFDPVIETILGGGRLVFVHSYYSRLLQGLWVRAVESIVEPIMYEGSHAYRPGRSRMTALRQARVMVGRGYRYAVKVDIRNFFGSVWSGDLDRVLRIDTPRMGRWLRNLGLKFLCPQHIALPPNSPNRQGRGRTVRPNGTIMPGSVVGPMLSNLYANHHLDQPFRKSAEAKLIRYSDDMLILGRTAQECESGMQLLLQLLKSAGLEASEEKSSLEPRDLMVAPLHGYLGKTLHGTSIITPDEELRRYARELAGTAIEGAEFRQKAKQIIHETALDGPGRLDRVVCRELARLSPDHRRAFRPFENAARTIVGLYEIEGKADES